MFRTRHTLTVSRYDWQVVVVDQNDWRWISVLQQFSLTGHLLRASTTTKNICLSGDPAKCMWTLCHGASGQSHGYSGASCPHFPTIRAGPCFSSISATRPGHQKWLRAISCNSSGIIPKRFRNDDTIAPQQTFRLHRGIPPNQARLIAGCHVPSSSLRDNILNFP